MTRLLLAFGGLVLALGAEILALIEVVIATRYTVAGVVALTGLHLFASVVLAETLVLRYAPDDPGVKMAWRTAFTLTFLIPVFGVIIAAILVVRPPRTVLVKVDDFISPMEYRQQQAEAELAAEADKGTAGVQVETIGDALKDTDKAKRLGAVEALRARSNKEAVDLLRQSLKNTIFEVRFHAVEALAGINKKFSDRIGKASAIVERDPSPANHRMLADVYYEYATMEMEEESLQQHLYRSAVSHYRQAAEPGKPAAPEILIRMATSLERLGETQKAWHSYKAVLQQRPGHYEALLGIAKLQYSEAQYDQLRDTCRQMLDLPNVEPAVTQVLTLWAEGPR